VSFERRSKVKDDILFFHLINGKVEVLLTEIEEAEGRIGFGGRIRCLNLDKLCLRCLFYIPGHKNLEFFSGI
jgi:hypothetical protein